MPYIPHRKRGRPRVRWFDDLAAFAFETFEDEQWLPALRSCDARQLRELEDAYLIFASPL